MSVQPGQPGGPWVSDPGRDGGGGSPGGAGAPGTPVAGQRPLGTVVASAVNGVGTLLRKHVELARIEATEAVTSRAAGAGLMAGAGAIVLFSVVFLAAAAAAALALVLPAWAADLVVAGALILAAGILVLVGRAIMRRAPKAESTRATVKESGRWAKRQLAR